MKIPEMVRIGPYRFKVEWRDEPRDDGDNRLMGQCRYAEQVIVLDKLMTDPHLIATIFLHEVMHAVDWMLATELNEKQVDRLATGLMMVLLDNNLLREGDE